MFGGKIFFFKYTFNHNCTEISAICITLTNFLFSYITYFLVINILIILRFSRLFHIYPSLNLYSTHTNYVLLQYNGPSLY